MAIPIQPEILVAHPWMGRGGSEATAMWALHALQDRAKVTFTTVSPVDWDVLNATYGTRISPDRVTLLPAPRLPGAHTGTVVAYWQRAWFERHCRKVSGAFDACISAYNPIRFGKPAIQLIGDFSFDETSRLKLYPNAVERVRHRPSLLRQAYLALGDKLSGLDHAPVLDPGDLVVANSHWTAARLSDQFQRADAPVLYPPALACEQVAEGPRDPLGFVCMGRITPEKEFETVLTILDRVRAAGPPVTLDLVGRFGRDRYSKHIRELVEARRDWVRTPGFLAAREKAALFARRGFGIHACRVEAFGIAIAEMAAAGVVPFVPAEGGVREIVANDALIFADADEAVAKILGLLAAPERAEHLRGELAANVARFTQDRFAANLLGIVQDFLGRPL